jgi:hypothetical protein
METRNSSLESNVEASRRRTGTVRGDIGKVSTSAVSRTGADGCTWENKPAATFPTSRPFCSGIHFSDTGVFLSRYGKYSANPFSADAV